MDDHGWSVFTAKGCEFVGSYTDAHELYHRLRRSTLFVWMYRPDGLPANYLSCCQAA